MKILVLTQGYPDEKNKYANNFIHSRNLFYLKENIEVTVLNFSASNDYVFESIAVYTESSFPNIEYDLVLSHAPNLKNHLRILKSKKIKYKKLCFFFHGHEALRVKNYYEEDYYTPSNNIKKFLRDKYDLLKLTFLKNYIIKNLNKVHLIFVSEWMKNEFLNNVCISESQLEGHVSIINNVANNAFLKDTFSNSERKMADFITIRPMNNPKYGVDIVDKIAMENPNYTFHIYGKGKYYDKKEIPKNVHVFDKFIFQEQIPDLLSQYKFALMPTRLDAQGVMMCEMATYGIPLITSDLPVCHEMLDEFSNVYFIDNEAPVISNIDLNKENKINKNLKFSFENTVQLEINLFKELIK